MIATNNNKNFEIWHYIAGAVAIGIAILLNLSSCSYDVEKNIAKIEHKKPIALPEYCANRFPVKESVKEVTKYLPGIETTIEKHDTINGVITIFKTKKVVDTFYLTKEITQEKTDKLKGLQLSLQYQTDSTTKYKAKAIATEYLLQKTERKFLKACGIISLMVILSIVYFVSKFAKKF